MLCRAARLGRQVQSQAGLAGHCMHMHACGVGKLIETCRLYMVDRLPRRALAAATRTRHIAVQQHRIGQHRARGLPSTRVKWHA
jgi:hypothetical protein